MTSPHRDGYHDCPHCRRPGVPNRLYACEHCWSLLPGHVQAAIYATSHMNVLEPARRVAFRAAREAYAAVIAARRQEIKSRKSGESNE